jgi:hypothetical protein
MVKKKVKTLEALPLGLFMAKRLTKALRGKRRWVGLVTAPSLQSRKDVEDKIDEIIDELDVSSTPRLMDFFRSDSETSRRFCTEILPEQEDLGLMILRIAHQDTPALRAFLSQSSALERYGMRTYTTSGKIRLVRQRMGIVKQPRHHR